MVEPQLTAHQAVANGELDDYRLLLSTEETTISTPDDLGNTALFYAAWFCQEEMTRFLLTQIHKQKDLDFQNKDGNTALHFACVRGPKNAKIIEWLLKSGVDPEIKNIYRESAQDIVKTDPSFLAFRRIRQQIGIEGVDTIKDSFLGIGALDEEKGPTSIHSVHKRQSLQDVKNDIRFSDCCEVFKLLCNVSHGKRHGKEAPTNILEIQDIAPIFKFMGQDLSRDELKDVLTELDANQDGKVTMMDFCTKMLAPQSNYDDQWDLDVPFNALDWDASGDIDSYDLKKACKGFPVLSAMLCARTHQELSVVVSAHADFKQGGKPRINKEMFKEICSGDRQH